MSPKSLSANKAWSSGRAERENSRIEWETGTIPSLGTQSGGPRLLEIVISAKQTEVHESVGPASGQWHHVIDLQ